VEELLQAQATNIETIAAASCMYGSMAGLTGSAIDPHAFVVYRNRLLEKCGHPEDPVEVMSVEQIALAHFGIARLHLRSGDARQAEVAVAYSNGAARRMAEFRRTALAWREFQVKSADHRSKSELRGGKDADSPTSRNGRANGCTSRKNGHDTELGGKEDVPEWLRKRMQYPTPDESPQAAATVGCGQD
jgi:hypothetical protein